MSYTKETISNLCQFFELPLGNKYTQDWVYELPEEFKTETYLDKYIKSYTNVAFSDNEKELLMELILDIANDLLQDGKSSFSTYWGKILLLLNNDKSIHKELIDYWALEGEDLDNTFALTPYIRFLDK